MSTDAKKDEGVSLSGGDYFKWAAVSAASFPLGYIVGRPTPLRVPSMLIAGFIGTMGGFGLAYASAARRARDAEFAGAMGKRQ